MKHNSAPWSRRCLNTTGSGTCRVRWNGRKSRIWRRRRTEPCRTPDKPSETDTVGIKRKRVWTFFNKTVDLSYRIYRLYKHVHWRYMCVLLNNCNKLSTNYDKKSLWSIFGCLFCCSFQICLISKHVNTSAQSEGCTSLNSQVYSILLFCHLYVYIVCIYIID